MLLAAMLFLNLASTNNSTDCIEFSGSEVFAPVKLGAIKLYKDDNGFHILKNGEIYDIQNCFCDPMLREMSDDQLKSFLGKDKPQIIFMTPEELEQLNPDEIVEITGVAKDKVVNQLLNNGYLSINQMDDGEYIIRAKTRGLGGGPISGSIAYWGTKFIAYGAVAATVGTIIVVTGGAAAGAIALEALGTLITGVSTATPGILVATGAGAAAAAGLATGAAIASTTAVTTLGVGGTVFATEAIATTAGLILGCLPTP